MADSLDKKRFEIPKGLGAIAVFTEGSEKGRQFPLLYTRTVMGRKKGDILIRDLAVSSEHAAIDYRRGIFHVVDLDSKNGTFINEKKIRDQQILLEQEVRLGDSIFQVQLDPEQFDMLLQQQTHHASKQRGLVDLMQKEFLAEGIEDTIASTKEKQKLPEVATKKYIKVKVVMKNGKGIKLKYVKPKVLIGREETDLVINDIEVSRKHAYLELQTNNDVVIQDLASANGTFVNGKRINRRMLVPSDKIQIGQTLIVFMGVQDRE
ncbi:MAG: FHA domain-containing protein [Proteobacteria bacterium]|jgi:pSer/pThr/pTyr-binding forkhead associated (FHA) protein|nr:FHA domain-containing protein [Pseudomonadota bacterium]